MADNLRWLTITAFPGVDLSTHDHLIQPPIQGPATMRRMVGADPFTEPGVFRPAKGYTQHSGDATNTTTQGFGNHVKDSVSTLYRTSGGKLLKFVGGEWVEVTTSLAPFHATNRTKMCNGRGALFIVDGEHRPRVVGWNYDVADQTVEWDSQHTVAEILYTNKVKTTPTAPADDFIAEGCCYHMERLVLWKGNKVHVSAPYAPTKFYDADNAMLQLAWFNVGEETGLDITWGGSFENQMLVFGNDTQLHAYIGSDPATAMSHILLDGERGVFAADSVAIGDGKLWFCAKSGPCYLDPKQGVKDAMGEGLTKLWDTLSEAQRRQVVGWFADGKYHIVLPIAWPSAQSDLPASARAKLTFNPNTKRWAQAWAPIGIPCTVNDPTLGRYMLIADDGTIYRPDHGALLHDATMVQELETPWLELGNEWVQKWLRSLRVSVQQSVTELTIEYGTDDSPNWTALRFDAPQQPLKWRASGDPLMQKWRAHGDAAMIRWTLAGVAVIRLAESVHCRKVRLRIRGKGLTVRSLGLGFDYEGV